MDPLLSRTAYLVRLNRSGNKDTLGFVSVRGAWELQAFVHRKHGVEL